MINPLIIWAIKWPGQFPEAWSFIFKLLVLSGQHSKTAFEQMQRHIKAADHYNWENGSEVNFTATCLLDFTLFRKSWINRERHGFENLSKHYKRVGLCPGIFEIVFFFFFKWSLWNLSLGQDSMCQACGQIRSLFWKGTFSDNGIDLIHTRTMACHFYTLTLWRSSQNSSCKCKICVFHFNIVLI